MSQIHSISQLKLQWRITVLPFYTEGNKGTKQNKKFPSICYVSLVLGLKKKLKVKSVP